MAPTVSPLVHAAVRGHDSHSDLKKMPGKTPRIRVRSASSEDGDHVSKTRFSGGPSPQSEGRPLEALVGRRLLHLLAETT